MNLECQLLEPYRGGLLDPEIKACRAAFARKNKVGPGYDAVWIDKKARLHAIGLMHSARMRAHEVVAPRYLRSSGRHYDGSDNDEAPEQALAGSSAPSPASSSKRVTSGKDGKRVQHAPKVANKQAEQDPDDDLSSPSVSTHTHSAGTHRSQATVAKKTGNKDIAAKSISKRLRRAHKQLKRAMAMMEEAQQEIAALIERGMIKQ